MEELGAGGLQGGCCVKIHNSCFYGERKGFLMNVMYVAPRYHTNQVPIIEGFIKTGDQVTFVSQYYGGTEDYSTLKPIIMGYPRSFELFLAFYKKIKKCMGKTGKDFVIQSKFGPLPKRRFEKLLEEKKPDIVIMRDRSVYNIGVTKVCGKKKIPALLYTQSPLWEEINGKGGIVRKFFRENTPNMRITPVLGNKKEGETQIKEGSYYVPFVMEPHIAPEEKLHFMDQKVQILGVGKYVGQKRHEMILQLTEDLKNREPFVPFHVTIVGEVVTQEQQNYIAHMEDFIKEHKLEEYITLKRNFNIQQVYEEYRKADIFVLPSKGEVASISHLEAMSCSLPVICSDSNGTSCYIKQGENGYIFKDAEYEDFRRYVDGLMDNREKIIEMGKESYRIVIQRHRFESYKEKVVEIQRMLQGGGYVK